jgi:transaldolase
MPSKLDQLRGMTTLVADSGDIETVARLKPQDCTTNPTLLLKAVQNEAYAPLIDEAVAWGRRQNGAHEAVITAIADRLAVSFGVKLSQLVPGRVSTEIDANLSFDTPASIAKARALIADYAARGVPRERILIKIAATWEGLEAARILQGEGIDCNLTLIFALAQAMRGADAGVFLISPFVGRILDWHLAQGNGPYEPAHDPGVLSVKAIYNAYKKQGASTVVMAASFRSLSQIEALAGCDRLTISPALLDALAEDQGALPRVLDPAHIADAPQWIHYSESHFRFALNEDAMASDKLSEGIRLFTRDLVKLHDLIRLKLEI